MTRRIRRHPLVTFVVLLLAVALLAAVPPAVWVVLVISAAVAGPVSGRWNIHRTPKARKTIPRTTPRRAAPVRSRPQPARRTRPEGR